MNDIPADWPMRDMGRRVRVAPHDWWVVEMGAKDAPVILMLHGTGASGHSFRALAPLLAPHYRLIIPDLPGHGFTRAGGWGRRGLDAMAEDILHLCHALNAPPSVVIGHSAGAAIGLRMGDLAPLRGVVGINAALGVFDGAAGVMFPLMARALASAPFVGAIAARMWGNDAAVARLLAQTGSPLDATGRALYARLVGRAAHVEGALAMMAAWRLEGLMARLPSLALPCLLIASDGDRTVPMRVSQDAAQHMPLACFAPLPRWGHLVHEEAAAEVAALILPWLAGLTPAATGPKAKASGQARGR